MILRQLSSAPPRLRPPPLTSGHWRRGASLAAPCRPPAPHPPWWWGHALSGRSLHSSGCLLMDRPRRDKEPPHKRRKSTEEQVGDDARTDHQGASRETRENGAKTRPERHSSKERTQTLDPPTRWTRTCGSRWDLGPGHAPMPPPEVALIGSSVRSLQARWGSTRQPSPPGPAPPGLAPPGPAPPGPGPSSQELLRHWETCASNHPPAGGHVAFDFSVLSYNILSQQLLEDNAYLYRHCPPQILSWDHRLPNLLAEIQRLDADVLCLQEVQEDHYQDQIRPALQAQGFQCEFKKRTGNKPDGCAVAFRTSRLSLVSSHPVEFYRAGDALLDRDNVGMVVLLRPGGPGSEATPLCVANTHLLYNPRRGDVKLAQLAVLLAEIRRVARRPDGSLCPVLLCGDLNSTPWSPLYRFLTTGRLQYQGLESSMVSGQQSSSRGQRLLQSPIWSHSLGISQQCQYQSQQPTVEEAVSELSVEDPARPPADSWTIEHALPLRSSYRHRLPPDSRPEISTFHSRSAMTVDYILYSPESSSSPSGRGLQLLGRLSLVGWSDLVAVNGLPNRQHSSDHLPLLARFRLTRRVT
ncbi:protein angel homolog 2 [Synchiropus splendidus]|uniref:protein angel homolog 2 n=1 Tax=Synchiropus splendidus TaxID=270530 RepID=UPI00237EE718|nr:protein angel homolog 2 [Synchiropus splendidus]XP_053736592.1 protein angel homolog 2 [Synchiropus splendidus]